MHGDAKKEIVIRTRIGSADGQFGSKTFNDGSWVEPSGIAIDSKKNIYIADPVNNRIQKFNEKGIFLSKIGLEMYAGRVMKTINDLAVDSNDNLYMVSRKLQKIFKYNEDGRLIFAINLKEQPISWNRYEGWHKNQIQAERISTDVTGNIYLEGFNELIKFDTNGKLDKKWSRENYSREASYFIDQSGCLYFSKKMGLWEKYDQMGNSLGLATCEKEPLLAYIPSAGGRCQFPPKFIDKNGFRYYFEFQPITSNLSTIVKVNKNGNSKRYKVPPIDIGQTPNMIKFDNEGNLYSYGEYWIEKYVFN